MDNVVDYLKQLDLSDVEAKLYLTLLQAGPTSVRDLAQTIAIKRTTTYFYIDQLVEKGLIMKIVKGSKKLVAANEPENLKVLVEAKAASAKKVEQDFPKILNLLSTSLPKENGTSDAEIRYYKGKNGVKKIYEDVLKTKELRSYVNIEEIVHAFPENLELFNKALNQNPNMQMYEIVENSPQSKKYVDFSKNSPAYHQKLLPKDMQLTAQDILIYDNKVAIINLRGNIHGIILYNLELFDNFKMLFNFTWKMLP